MGILKLLTGGCFGILYIIDIINIATGKLAPADGSGYSEDFAGPANPPQLVSSAYDDLEKIARLHDQGALSDEEFSKMKADLLERM
jgi:hypothetical protein